MTDKARQDIQPFIDWLIDNSKIDKIAILYNHMETYLAEIKSEMSDKPALNIADVTHRIREMSIEQKHKLFSLWVAKIREEGHKTLDVLFALDDEYMRIYKENRVKSFKAGQLLGYKQILTIFYGG